jgi:hypothetical protein
VPLLSHFAIIISRYAILAEGYASHHVGHRTSEEKKMKATILAASLVAASAAEAAILVNDQFTDNERTSTTTVGSTLTSIPWYVSAPNSNNGTLGTVTDASFGQYALSLTNANAGNSVRAIGVFATTPQTLVSATGDQAVLRVDFRITDTASNNVRIGLANSNGAVIGADNNDNSSSPAINDFGYWIQINTGTSASASTELRTENGTQASIFGGTDSGPIANTAPINGGSQSFVSPYSSIAITDANIRKLQLTLTKTATGVTLGAVVTDASNNVLTSLTATPSATYTFTAFNQIVFGNGTVNTAGIIVDNVFLETLPVPEPASIGMLFLAGGTLARRRRA